MRTDSARLPRLAILASALSIALSAVAGCGQTGPLYLPESQKAEQPLPRSADPDKDGRPANAAVEANAPSVDQTAEPLSTTGD